MAVFNFSDIVGNYTIQNLIKSNLYTETYRVIDVDNNVFFLKLFDMKLIPKRLVNKNTEIVREIEYCRSLRHRNLVNYIADGNVERDESSYQYYVTTYFDGAILQDSLNRKGAIPEEKALQIFRCILNGLDYLHSQVPSLCHNDLDCSNIMLSEIGEEPIILDMGHLSERINGNVTIDTSDLNLFYHANETKMGRFDEQSDIFSACAVLYTMLTNQIPWLIELSNPQNFKEGFTQLWLYRQTHDLPINDLSISMKTKYILTKGLALKANERFMTVGEVIDALDSTDIPQIGKSQSSKNNLEEKSYEPKRETELNAIDVDIKRGKGNGFEDIAGMQQLKDYLMQKVIFVIKNKDVAQEYRLTPPNGMLLYGPPGCGKTYFAEKFAEETGFNFMVVKSSDIGSSLVHGTQEKVKKLFQQAEKNAPIVLCFDEFDALVPNRGAHGNEYVATEVNEFLSQMNNCSQRGIFIVATSNRPDKIDPAVLRTGRIDKQVFVPLPDFEARKEMFNMYLKSRPIEDDIDLDALAQATEGYIASDIAFIVNDAAMTAAFTRQKISHALLITSTTNNKPSLRKEVVEEYACIKDQMNSIARRVIVEAL